jgi:tryptophanyl-tRNA synthetase
MDDEDAISRKIRKAKTDPDGLPSDVEGLKGRPEADNLVGIYAALADKTKAEVLAEFGGQQFSVFKPALVDIAVNVLSPITGEMRRLMDDTSHIDAILKKGGERARERAEVTMNEVRDIIGFLR